MTQMTTQTPTAFARRIRAELQKQDLSVRGLARKIDPKNVDRVRRNLHRWLDEGILPHRASRAEVAVALGLEPSALDDEEPRQMTLDDFLEQRVEQIVQTRLKALAAEATAPAERRSNARNRPR